MLGARMLEAVVASALLGKAGEVLLLKKRVQSAECSVRGVEQPGPMSDLDTSSLLGACRHLTRLGSWWEGS